MSNSNDSNNSNNSNNSNYSNSDKKLLPWAEKYRPKTIPNIIYHEKITKSIINYIEANNLPHLLFYGPAGTGKTSTIITIAKHYYREDFYNMILILNASEERGIETVRNRIKQFVTTYGIPENSTTPPFKLIILDEIDAMTEDAQAILRKVIEKYVNNVRFCFICNYLKKINPAIQSRCIIFRFKPIPSNYLYDFVIYICTEENIKIKKNAMNLIIKRSGGDMRKLLNILQSIYMYINNNSQSASINFSETSEISEIAENPNENSNYILINDYDVSKILSCPTDKEIIKIIKFIQKNNFENSYVYISNFVNNNGISLEELITCVYEYFMKSIIDNDNTLIKYPLEKSVKIIKNMSLINENLTYCNNDSIQLISFISIFYI